MKKTSIPAWVWAVLAVITAAALLITRPWQSPTIDAVLPREVSVSQAAELVQGGAFLLDVRTREEWDDAHVAGATLIPLDELPDRLDEIPADQTVVVMCRSGGRSATGRDILLQAGFEQVTSMAGGITQWVTAGYPTE